MPLSPELETLDQLLGGDLSLTIIRTLYANDEHFNQAIAHLLADGDVALLSSDGTTTPEWRHAKLFGRAPVLTDLSALKLRITEKGAHKIT